MTEQVEGRTTAISWCDHTFNLWWGCEHAPADDPTDPAMVDMAAISEECRNCYAETLDHRLGGEHWGPGREPKWSNEKYWSKLRLWNARAERERKRRRVFISSMADWAQRNSTPVVDAFICGGRARMFSEIQRYTWLDYMLLTKRAERLVELLPWLIAPAHGATLGIDASVLAEHAKPWPHVWVGVTAGTRRSMWRVAKLRAVPAAVRFISAEPLLDHISAADWDEALAGKREQCCDRDHDRDGNCPRHPRGRPVIDMLIVGDESGNGRRPTDHAAVATARDAAERHGVAFHLKQLHINDRKIHLPVFQGRVHDAMPGAR